MTELAAAVYILCALTSLTAAVLLLRGYLTLRVRFLLWSGAGFVGFAVSNLVLVVDTLVVPEIPLPLLWRMIPELAGLGVLVYGLVWDTR